MTSITMLPPVVPQPRCCPSCHRRTAACRVAAVALPHVVSPRPCCRVSCRRGRAAACRVAVVALLRVVSPPPVVLLPMPSCCRVLCHVAFAAHRAVATLLLLASPLRGECWDWCVQPIHRT